MATGSCWQAERTVLECNRFMLENEIATDVCFEVGPAGGATANIRAHRYMLIARSAVFEAMFASGLSESRISGLDHKIRIEDIEPWVFKQILNFIYYEEANVTQVSALPLMYAAKKYMLPRLVKQCGECLQRDLTVENVGEVLGLSIFFSEEGLKARCLELISRYSTELMKPEIFNKLSYESLDEVLSLDSICVEETVIYRSCVDWAKEELRSRQSVTNPSDQQIRETLRDLVYKIRFPIMQIKDFADLVVNDSVLTFEEQAAIFCFIGNRHKRPALLRFNCDRRLSREDFVDRTVTCDGSWGSGPDAINVKTSHNILLTGLGLFTEHTAGGSGYTVDVEILKSDQSLYKKSFEIPHTGNTAPYKVSFGEPVSLEAHTYYTVVANSSLSKVLYRGVSCQAICVEGSVAFTFSTSGRTNNGTNVNQGQIPRLYFRSAVV